MNSIGFDPKALIENLEQVRDTHPDQTTNGSRYVVDQGIMALADQAAEIERLKAERDDAVHWADYFTDRAFKAEAQLATDGKAAADVLAAADRLERAGLLDGREEAKAFKETVRAYRNEGRKENDDRG